ncbi:MAG: tetratricopeptide repeat protein [Phycisphaerales bacterium]
MVPAFLAVHVCCIAFGVAQTVQTDAPVAASATDEAKVLTVAIMPFHNEGGDDFKYLQTQIAISAGAAIQESGRAVIVNRDYVATIVDEKRMAESGLTPAPKQPIHGQMIAADIIAFGRYDVYDGKLTITGELIPAQNYAARAEAAYWRDRKVPLKTTRVEAAGRLNDAAQVLVTFGKRMVAAVPNMALKSVPGKTVPADKSLAVFDLTTGPDQKDLHALAGAVTERLSLQIAQTLHVKLVERQRFDNILQEHRMAMAGLSDRGRSLSLGRLLNADFILVGSAVGTSDRATVDVQLLDVSTGTTLAAASRSQTADVIDLADRLDRDLSKSMERGLGAIEHLRAHRQFNGSEAVSLIRMATSVWHNENGRHDDRKQRALNLMWAALDMAPDSAEVNSEVGHLYTEFKQYDLAEHYYRRSVELDLSNHWYQCRLGLLYKNNLNRTDDAEAAFRRALEISGPRQWGFMKYSLNLAQILETKGQVDEGIEVARKGLLGSGYSCRAELQAQLGKMLESKGRIKEAAAAYERGVRLRPQDLPSSDFQAARRLLLASDQHDKAMQVLHLQIQVGKTKLAEDYLELAEYYADRSPALAAELCYAVRRYINYESYHARAVQVLRDHHLPLQRPIFTGSVFDIDQCRDLGIRVVIQPYEGFRHMRWMAYLKAHMEDMLGVEVVIGEGQRQFSDNMYNRTTNQVGIDDYTFFSLEALRKQYKTYAAIGLTSNPQVNGWITHRWRRCLSMTTTAYCDGDYPSRFNEAGLYSLIYPQIAKSMTYDQEIQSWNSYDPVCLADSCIARKWSEREIERVPVLCPACRHDLRRRYPEYPLGPESRPPLEVGPRLPAIRGGEKLPPILLVTLGFKSGTSHAQGAAAAMEMATGLPVKIIEQPTLPPLQTLIDTDDFKLITADALVSYGMKLAADHESASAVCLLVNEDFQLEYPRWLPWYMRYPDGKDAPKDLNCPIIVTGPQKSPAFTVCELIRRLTHLETATDPRNPDKPFPVPMYAKYFVAGLAAAAIPDHQCWTYGCPTTIWENIGDAARCSYWLCNDCRAAMRKYYAKSITR